MLSTARVLTIGRILRINGLRIHFSLFFRVRLYVVYRKRAFGADAQGCGLMRYGRA